MIALISASNRSSCTATDLNFPMFQNPRHDWHARILKSGRKPVLLWVFHVSGDEQGVFTHGPEPRTQGYYLIWFESQISPADLRR